MDKIIRQHLNWLTREKVRDQKQLDVTKKQLIEEVKQLNKEQLFKKNEPPKLSIWKKIKLILLGN